jgi:hypothetical protein
MLWVLAGLAMATALPALVVGSVALGEVRGIQAPKRATFKLPKLLKAKPVAVKKAVVPKPVYKGPAVPFGKSSGRPSLRKSA